MAFQEIHSVHFSLAAAQTSWTPDADVQLVGVYAAGGDILISTDPAADVAVFQANPAVDQLAIAQIAGSSSIYLPLSTPARKGQPIFISADSSLTLSLFYQMSAE